MPTQYISKYIRVFAFVVCAGGFGKIDLIQQDDKEYVGKSQNVERDDMRELVEKEIRILKQLKGHQNIVQIINHAYLSPQELYIVLEYCEGMIVAYLIYQSYILLFYFSYINHSLSHHAHIS